MTTMVRTALAALLTLALSAAHADQANAPGTGLTPEQYTAELHAQYGARLHYDSAASRKAVQSIALPCGEHAWVPLETFLLVGLKGYQGNTYEERYVQRAPDGEIRVLATAHHADGFTSDKAMVILRVDKWGEINSRIFTSMMLYALCTGSLGPLVRRDAIGEEQVAEDAAERFDPYANRVALSVGTTWNGEKAHALAARLRKDGYPAYVLSGNDGYTLRVAPFNTEAEARAAASKIRGGGYSLD